MHGLVVLKREAVSLGAGNESVDVRLVLGLTLLFQFASAALAFRLGHVTGGRWAWVSSTS